MRILIITDWNRAHGGAEAYIARLFKGLSDAGEEVRLLTSSAGSAGNGKADYVAYGTENAAMQTFLQISNPFASVTVRNAMKAFQPEVVLVNMFAHHLSPSIFSEIKGVPILLIVSDYKCICPIGSKLLPDGNLCQVKPGRVCLQNGCLGTLHWLRDQFRYKHIRSALQRVDKILACSQWVQAELAEHGLSSEVLLLPDSKPSVGYRRVPSQNPSFLFLGRLDAEKGVELLLNAFAHVYREFPDSRLKIAGRGPLQTHLEGVARDLQITDAVDFLGWLSRDEVEAQLIDPWALVVPSLWAEPLGLVAVEAVTRAVPVIVSESGGLAEIVESGVSGLHFSNNDEEALRDCMTAVASRTVFADHILPQEVVARVVQAFNVQSHISKIRGIFRAAIANCELER